MHEWACHEWPEIKIRKKVIIFYSNDDVFTAKKMTTWVQKKKRKKETENPSLYDSFCVFLDQNWDNSGCRNTDYQPIFHSILLLPYSILWTRYSNSQQKYFLEVKLNGKIHFCIAISTCHSEFKCAMYAIIAMQRGAHTVAHSEPKLNYSFGNCLWTQSPSSPVITFFLIQN